MSGYEARSVWRGDVEGGGLEDFRVEVNEGEVVLDIIHRLQATQAPDLAVRWNCKAGKCGSCSAEINGRPRLLCMTRMSVFTPEETITVTPLRAFPVVRDLVTDVGFNYTKAREVPSFVPPADLGPGEYRMMQEDVDRSQEFRKCIECFLCQDTRRVVRGHEENKPAFAARVSSCASPNWTCTHWTRPATPAWTVGARAQDEHGLGYRKHHQVLHGGLPRGHQDHRQRADPAEGTGGGPQVRPAGVAGVEDPASVLADPALAVPRPSSSPSPRSRCTGDAEEASGRRPSPGQTEADAPDCGLDRLGVAPVVEVALVVEGQAHQQVGGGRG